MSYKDETDDVYSGSFGVQVLYGRLLREKDVRYAPPEMQDRFLKERISLYPESFGPMTKPWDRFLRLRRAGKKPLPVKEHRRDGMPHLYRDSTVSLKPGGKWKLNVPVEAEKVRKPILVTPTKICGVDPGVRKMLAVFDETDKTVHYYGRGDGPLSTKLRRLRDRARALSDKASKAAGRQVARDYSRGSRKLLGQMGSHMFLCSWT